MELANEQIWEAPIGDIFLDEIFNCRGPITPMEVSNLAKTIAKDGQQAPIIIQPWDKVPGKKFRIVSGHRRFCAIKKLGWPTIKAIINDKIRDEFHAKTLNFIENLKRKDLNLMQEAKALEIYTLHGWTMKDISEELEVSIGWVQQRLNVLKLPADIQLEAAAGYINVTQVSQLVTLTQEQQYSAVKRIKEARERGETRAVTVRKAPLKPLSLRLRKQEEIFEMQTIIRNALGNSLATRVMGWCAAEVSTYEIYRDIESLCKDAGIPFHVPDEIRDAYNNP